MGSPDGVSNRDDHLADWIESGIGDRVRYDHGKEQWHIWDGFIWAPDKKDLIYELVHQQAEILVSGAKDYDQKKDFLTLHNWAKKTSVLKTLAARPQIALVGDEWDPDPFRLAFTNGVLDLRTLHFEKEPSPEWLISKSTRQPYDPAAECPLFAKFMLEIMGDNEEMAEYLMRVLGYAMFGLQSEQQFWMWVGGGQNGKGVLARVITAALGDYSDTPSDTLYMRNRLGAAPSSAARPDLLRLQGVRFTYMSEPNGGKFDEELIKAHTGEDWVIARDLYGKAASMAKFQATHTIVFLTNNPPTVDDVGVSMQRRVRIVRFEQDFTGARAVKGLDDILKLEAPGILNLLTRYSKQWWEQKTLADPPQVTRWSSDYIEENDPLSGFIGDYCVVERNIQSSGSVMWGAYQDWCATKGIETGSQTGFGLALGRRFKKKHTRNGMMYVGIKPKSAIELAESD